MIKLSDDTIFDTKTGIYYSIKTRLNPGMPYDYVVTITSIHNCNEDCQLVIDENANRFWDWLKENCVNF